MASNPVDPLDNLFLDNQPLDTALLAKAVEPYLRFYGTSAEIVTNNEWEKLSAYKKILVYLLGRKILRIKEFVPGESEKTSPSDLEVASGIKGGTLRPTLSRLVSDRLVRRVDDDSGQGYLVPDHAVATVYKVLATTGGSDE